MSDEQVVGERRRRREAERAAQQAAGAEQERPLTRREIRAREAALQTGELKIDETGEIRVARAPESAPEEPDLDGPATGMIGMTRRQLRALREQQAAAAAGAAASTPTAAPSAAVEAPVSEPAPSEPASDEPAPSAPAPSEPAVRDVTPARGSATAAPTPPLRRPVVRPPAAAGSVRSLTEDGAGLAPVAAREQAPSDPSSPATWSTRGSTSVDVTGSLPAIVADPGPLPTTRRTMRVAEAATPEDVAPPATLDELIAGDSDEPAPFEGKPSWPDLPPPTPAHPMDRVGAAASADATPPAEGSTEVIDLPEPAALPTAAATTAVAESPNEPPTSAVGDSASEQDEDEGGDEHEDEHDDHRTPRWLTVLMWLVLIVIGIVLGLLIWQLWRGEGSAGAAATIWQGWKMTHGATT